MNGKVADGNNEAEVGGEVTSVVSVASVASIENSSGVVAPPSKFRIQRNYRQKSPSKVENKEIESTVVSETTNKENEPRRSASPDVIPIIAEPETLVIDSSSESEEKTMPNKRQASVAGENTKQKEPPVKVVRLSDAEEGEIVDEDENGENANETTLNDEEKKIGEGEGEGEGKGEEKEDEDQSENKEMQEIGASVDNNKVDEQTTTTTTEITPTTPTPPPTTTTTIETITTTISAVNNESNVEIEEQIEAKTLPASEENVQPMIDTDDTANEATTAASGDDDDEGEETANDDEDDIISLGGGDLEMIDDVDCVEKKLNMEYDDIISLDSSGDELIKDEEAASAAEAAAAAAASWQDRYVKSTKVNKVLTASRLNKRVREKLMAQKREIKAAAEEADAKAKADALRREEKRQKAFMSKHADGTIEQYKELIEMQKKEKKKNK